HAERLRWQAELVVSAGRGYLVTGDATFLGNVFEAEASFNRAHDALRRAASAPRSDLLVEIERTADAFVALQAELLRARSRGADPVALADRFELELIPRRRELAGAVNAFVEQKLAEIRGLYREDARDRAQLARVTHGLLGLLIVVAAALSWRFARLLARSYEKEREADRKSTRL